MSSEEETTLSGDGLDQPRARTSLPGRGELVGRYMLLQEIGRGAMGVVHAAYDPELDRKIALKLMLDDDPQARMRLQREARALARVNHPNVITVHDVGMAHGRVFIAMELVSGTSLARAIETRRPWREVLELFEAAGRGLAAAHRAGLVHRDFKPANVLVDEDGRVLVTDFGLARLVERGDARDRALTKPGRGPGTPAYMAPEQVTSESIDARADQFAFCVALFEGLCGRRPFVGETVAELSARAALGVAEMPREGGVPRWLRRIVLRGLAPEPERRFASMDALLREVRLGRGRASSFRWGAGVGVALVGAAAWLGLSTPGQDACEATLAGAWDETRGAAIEAAFAATPVPYAAAAARQVTSALDEHARAITTMMHEACSARAGGTLGEEPYHRQMACLAARRDELGALVDVLTEADATVVDRAIAAVERIGPAVECTDASSLPVTDVAAELDREDREQLDRAAALQQVGKYDEAHALSIELGGRTDSAVARARAQLGAGRAAQRLGRFVDAERTLVDALVEAEAAGDDETVAEAAEWLVVVVGADLGRADEGLRWARLGEAAAVRAGALDRHAVPLEGNRAMVEGQRGNFVAAERHTLHAIELAERSADPDDVNLGLLLMNAGAIRGLRKDYAGARELLERAHAILRGRLPAAHTDVAIAASNLAQAIAMQGETGAAATAYEQLLHEQSAAYGRDHVDVARIEFAYAHVLGELGRDREARDLLDHAVTIFLRTHGPHHQMLARALNSLVIRQLAIGDTAAAVSTSERAVAIVTERTLGAEVDGDAHFMLAQALSAARADPARVQLEAERAMEAFSRESWLAERKALVDAWLRERSAAAHSEH
jgi:tetratricopeptide (TPR) repeat protein/predicted Ser/Thr protein kinase